jgi:gliding motility-associated lipoprotein GldH
MMKMNRYIGKQTAALTCFLLLLVIHSCRSDLAYAESKSISSGGWAVEDTLVFSPVLEQADAPCDLYVWVRHTKDYAYSNIWLKVESELDLNTRDGLVEIKVADKSGKWLGTCSQSLCTVRLALKEDLSLDADGAFKVEVIQYMRETSLQGVRNVGLELVRLHAGE